MLSFKADRTLTVPNMILVLQPNTALSEVGVSLTTRRPAADGTTVAIGEYVRDMRVDKLIGVEIPLRGAKLFIAGGSMIRTPTAIYKPRDAILQFKSISEAEASGTIKGTFYRFAAPQTAMTRPTEVEVDATFTARLIVR